MNPRTKLHIETPMTDCFCEYHREVSELFQLLGECRDMLDNIGGCRGVPELQERIDHALKNV
jgi:hypothetical protein